MSVRWMNIVWQTSPTRGTLLVLHLALADASNDEGVSNESIAALAKKARISKSAAWRGLNKLAELGLVRVSRTPGKRSTFALTPRENATVDPATPRENATVTPLTPRENATVTPLTPRENATVTRDYFNSIYSILFISPDGAHLPVRQRRKKIIELFNRVTNNSVTLNRAQLLLVIKTIDENKIHGEKLKAAFDEWVKRGHKPENLGWLDWAITGEIPQLGYSRKNGGNGQQVAEMVLREIARVGRNGTPNLPEDIMQRIADAGGWRALCNMRPDDVRRALK